VPRAAVAVQDHVLARLLQQHDEPDHLLVRQSRLQARFSAHPAMSVSVVAACDQARLPLNLSTTRPVTGRTTHYRPPSAAVQHIYSIHFYVDVLILPVRSSADLTFFYLLFNGPLVTSYPTMYHTDQQALCICR